MFCFILPLGVMYLLSKRKEKKKVFEVEKGEVV